MSSNPQTSRYTADERTWAMLAHFSILLNLVTGFLGPVTALVINLYYRDRSEYVANQAMQSFLFQLLWWVGGGFIVGAAWAVTGVLSVVFIGLLLIPVALLITLIPVVALVYGVWAGIQAYNGDDFKYWLIGDWVKSF